MSKPSKLPSRRLAGTLLAGGALTAASESQAQDAPPTKVREKVRLIHLEIGDQLVVRRDPQSQEAVWSSIIAFDGDRGDVSALRQPVRVSRAVLEDHEEPPPLTLPEQVTGIPDLADVEPLDEGEILVLRVTYLEPANQVLDQGGVLITSPRAAAVVTPAPVKLSILTFSFEITASIRPPCAPKSLRAVRIKVDAKTFLGTNRLCSTYLSKDGSQLYLHGEIGFLFTTYKWCWKFSSQTVLVVQKCTWFVAQALEWAGYRETASKVTVTVNALLAAVRKISPGLIP